ncbi:PD-(D/E)XK nuclease family protein [Streptomyces synnematoformans]|uniref:PD-(D/E)XK nuclease family protein n=1 Tax=Streptomyces synnematoformans TaxID=415721 RepID=UPI0031DA4086
MLDDVEHRGKSVDAAVARMRKVRTYLPAHRDWAEEAARRYLAARSAFLHERHVLGEPETRPADEEWVVIDSLPEPDARGAARYERTAWGRRYATPDGSLRELWLPSVNVVKEDRPRAEVAEAAAVAAEGVPAHSEFRRPYRPVRGSVTLPQRVRVVAVGCGDGITAVLADRTREEAVQDFRAHARPVLARVVEGEKLIPGSSCVDCEALATCAEPPRVRQLLGVRAPRRPRRRRSVSVSDLRAHSQCPARFHLTRVLHLRSGEPESAAIRRGRAVDNWLNERHGAWREGSCRDTAPPDALPGLAEEEQPVALRLVRHHASRCPVAHLAADETVRVQPRVTAYDPDLDVIVIADADLLYTQHGGWVWRETKTAARRVWEGRPLLKAYPQLALAVLLLAAGVPGGDPRRSRVELEVLHPDGAACEELDPGDSATVDEARAALAGLAAGWALDEEYPAKPGDHCVGCEAQRWCAPGRAQVEG